MYLKQYMTKADNLVAREQLLFHRLMYDLKLEVAKVGHNLLTTTPEVDRDGYDVTLWLDTDTTYIQCKAFAGKPPSNWTIHKKVISPSSSEKSDIQHRGHWYTHDGYGGGVIAIAVQATEKDLEVAYYYVDLLTIWAMSQGLVLKNKDVRGIAEGFLDQLMTDDTRIRIPRSLFIRPRTNAHLLALMGIEALVPHFFRVNLRHILVDNRGQKVDTADLNIINRTAVAGLRDCSTDFV